MTTPCRACDGAHFIQACPELRALLLAPEVCVDCGDALGNDTYDGICGACLEYECREQLCAERDRWGISLDLRARILLDSCTIDSTIGF